MIFFLLEEQSMKSALKALLPKIIPDKQYKLIPHNGKMDLKQAIPKVVPSLSKNENAKIVIIQDKDNDVCLKLKNELLSLTRNAKCPILVRIACEELEAWFLGDMRAIERAFPRFKADNYINKKPYRKIDKIKKPSLVLKKLIPELKDYDIFPKRKIAEAISYQMNIDENRSTSFKNLVTGLCKF